MSVAREIEQPRRDTADVVIVGAGAAGLAAAIFCARAAPEARIVCVDGAKSIGAKILVSGGGRCNVTNRVVIEEDFSGGDRRFIRNVLRAYPAPRAAAFFAELGVSLHEEEDGKYFPVSNRARTVLDALLSALRDCGASLEVSRRVERVERVERGFMVTTRDSATYEAPLVVLATGGRSLPKTGSDGAGYAFARALGHGCVETTPALVPLLLADSRYATLTGVTHNVGVTVTTDGGSVRLDGAMLWTHFGLSGPVILNASRHWLRARVEGRAAAVLLHVLPRTTFAELEHWLQTQQRQHPRALVRTVVASRLPASVADAWVEAAGIDRAMTLAHLARDARRTLIATLLETPLDVTDSRGYNYAEVTAGGIPLGEIDSATMESRLCPGLYLIGEILDVDGRIGGFNFQWAWSSAWVAANAIGRKLRA
ncbi:MAG TPA: aminoacetone oxidase family FAD-binding enzyme [Vicinamibacterales bacterium]|jgi:predicted Rossmann fold flavoprotein|nr:aminoacetone oxidase family FAD-binding enzyme [Vicinamibacterales bacterium]